MLTGFVLFAHVGRLRDRPDAESVQLVFVPGPAPAPSDLPPLPEALAPSPETAAPPAPAPVALAPDPANAAAEALGTAPSPTPETAEPAAPDPVATPQITGLAGPGEIAGPVLAVPVPATPIAPPPPRLQPTSRARIPPRQVETRPPRLQPPVPAVPSFRATLPSAAAPGRPVGASTPGPAPVVASAASSAGWERAVGAWIAAHKRYPEIARERGEEGAVGLQFTVVRDGQVAAVTVPRTSGFAALDTAARELVQGQRLPPFPADMPDPQRVVSVTIHYTLQH